MKRQTVDRGSAVGAFPGRRFAPRTCDWHGDTRLEAFAAAHRAALPQYGPAGPGTPWRAAATSAGKRGGSRRPVSRSFP